MSDWPEDLRIGPLGTWPGTLTRPEDRKYSPFKAHLSSTLTLLDRELYNLVDTRAQQESAELLIAIPAEQFTVSGRPYARAIAAHPGVILSLDSRYGHLSYPCDTFTTWQSNLRAIALALEALRMVDRYGVTKRGEQYRGFLALEAAPREMFADAHAALAWLTQLLGDEVRGQPIAKILRTAKRTTHPDAGGTVESFQRVQEAERALRAAGDL